MDQNYVEKRLSSVSPDEERREENKTNQEISRESPPSPKLDRFKLARHLTEKAIKDKKIFSIYGHYPVIRNTLRRKGWVEKKFNCLSKVVPNGEEECEGDPGSVSNESKYVEIEEENEMIFQKSNNIHDVMSRLVKTEIPYFLWTIKRDVVDYHNLSGDQMLNHYGKTASFTTKIGLCMNMRNLPWYVPANPHTFFPRCYGLCSDGEKQEFLEDFRRTAASSILKWVVNHHSYNKNKYKIKKEESEEDLNRNKDQGSPEDRKSALDLPGELIEAACKVCETYLGQLEHDDIDLSAESLKTLSESEWKELIQQYYNLIHGDAYIPASKTYFAQCQTILNKIMSVNPQSEIDGMRNIWILKPGAKSRGRDIICMDRVEEIMKLVTSDNLPSKDNKWVVQKYIETPLLIYDTKFDIRQWFLVTDWNPLTIWFYKESYLRFSTQRFSLDSLDSAIHLCNNSIQKHFKNAKDRSPLLPCYNMWTSTKFQEYLQKRGRGNVWHNIIYPSMKKAITHTMKVAQDHVEARKNSFELYGADFILGKDFKPWLIEINSSPTMFPSTPVTAQLCAQVQEDTIKVVVDRKTDRNCDIGNFELLWRQPAVELPPFNGSNLFVEGFSIQKGKKHGTPITTISLGNPLPAGHIVRNRGSQQDQAPEQAPASKQDPKAREDKGMSCILPMPLKRGSGRTYKFNSVYNKALGTMEFPSFAIRHLENISHKAGFPKAKNTKLADPSVLSTASIASVLQTIRSLENPVFQPPKGSGLRETIRVIKFPKEDLMEPPANKRVATPRFVVLQQPSHWLLRLVSLFHTAATQGLFFGSSDPALSLSLQFTTPQGSWVRCPFATGNFAGWRMKIQQVANKFRASFVSRSPGSFQVHLCNRTEPFHCRLFESITVGAQGEEGAIAHVDIPEAEVCSPEVCIQGWRTDVNYSVPVQMCDIRCKRSHRKKHQRPHDSPIAVHK
ncbi:protein monoglycylase TTLL8 [Gracilinanus agilis]|uniref:protein monoglycylase TTLL8 n=1 Tax=Gracilinanus agilis TaxID=191870 RepID=UPI001CFDFE52|nr:protein monoglycylase TTLL8 [Gracilinanus agilis]